jgi:hypothetical protein
MFLDRPGCGGERGCLLLSQDPGGDPGGLLWAIDVAARLLTGRHLFGGTEYMWDGAVPLFVRLLSLFHWSCRWCWCWPCAGPATTAAAWPADRRHRAAPGGRAPAGGGQEPELRLHRSAAAPAVGPGAAAPGGHVVGTALVVYLPTHLVLRRTLRRAS